MKFLFLGNNNEKSRQRLEEILLKRGHSLKHLESDSSDRFSTFGILRDAIIGHDAVIADSTGLDPETEFQLAYTLQADKQILVTEYVSHKVPKGIKNSEAKRLYIKPYEDKLELEDAIDQFINILESNLDAKLFMIIPPEVNKYLEWVASHTDKSKSDVVRSAIIDVANKDKDYQIFLKKLEH